MYEGDVFGQNNLQARGSIEWRNERGKKIVNFFFLTYFLEVFTIFWFLISEKISIDVNRDDYFLWQTEDFL